MVLAHNLQSVERTEDIKINNEATFQSLMLSKNILDGLTSAGFITPSPIQLQGIPLGKLGLDLILEAKSGTGKTVVFSTIALQKLNLNKGLQVIIVTPTREIAAQICDVLKQIGCYCDGLGVEMVIGGLSFQENLKKLKNNVHILVGTPGRLIHLMKGNHINTSGINLLILDEADKLMSSSFEDDILYLHTTLPKEKQVILSSATFPESIENVVKKLFKNPHHLCPDTNSVLLGVSHSITFVNYNSNSERQTEIRFNELTKILSKTTFKQCVIFCNYQARVTHLHKLLTKAKWPAELVYGKQEQTTRLEALKTLQEYKCRIMISTDLLSRGIDSKNVDLVINFEPPDSCETYLHRIGRSGRYGTIGMAISILCEGEESVNLLKLLSPIIQTINLKKFWTGEKVDSTQYLTSNGNETPAEDEIKEINEMKESREDSDSKDKFWTSLVKDEDKRNIESFDELCYSYNTSNDTAKIQSFSELLDDFNRSHDVEYSELETMNYNQLHKNNIKYPDSFDAVKKLEVELFNDAFETENYITDEKNTLQNGNLINNKNNCENICNDLPSGHTALYRNQSDFELELPKSFHESKVHEKVKKSKNKKNSGHVIANNDSYNNAVYKDNTDIFKKDHMLSLNMNFKTTKEVENEKISTIHVKGNQPTEESQYSKEQEYNKWYNQLKLSMKQIETVLYLQEMNN